MKPTLQVRLSQHLALTPQLQQSIRLLQLSTLELHQEVEQMLEQNPFLEPEEERGSFEEQILADRASASSSSTASDEDSGGSGEGSDEPAGMEASDFGTTERDDWENGTEGTTSTASARPPAPAAGPAATTSSNRRTAPAWAPRCRTTCATSSAACAWPTAMPRPCWP
jgi:RNA polymerase sigma-54 factor